MSVSLRAPDKPAVATRSTLDRVFGTLSAQSCPLEYNFHMHTVCSDGRLFPEELAAQAVEIGLQGFAITDHHSVLGYCQARDWLDRRGGEGLPILWSGIEINAGLLGTEVHILGYGFDLDSSAIAPYTQGKAVTGKKYAAEAVVKAIQRAGGLAILAHPFRYRVGGDRLIAAAAQLGFDGIEAYYAYDNPDPWRPSEKQTRQAECLADRYGLFATCGTDTHGTNLRRRL